MECTEVREEFSAMLDDELAPEVRAAVEAHLTDCSACLRALAEYKRVDALYRGLPAQRAPEGFEERVRAAVHPKIVRFPRRTFARKRVWPLLAAAATFLVILGGLVVQQQRAHRGRFDIAAVPGSKRGPSAVDTVAPQEVKGKPISEFEGIEDGASRPEEAVLDEKSRRVVHRSMPSERPAPEPPPAAAPLAPEAVEAPALAEEMAPPRALPKGLGTQPELEREVAAPQPEPLSRGRGTIEQDKEGQLTAGTHLAKFKKDETKAVATENAIPAQAPAAPPPAPAPPVLRAPETVGAGQTLLADSAETAFAGKRVPVAPEKTAITGDTAAPGAVAASRRTIAGRVFNFREGIWRQEGYRRQKTTLLKRDSEVLRKLEERHPEVAEILALHDRVVFRLDDTWYELPALPPSRD